MCCAPFAFERPAVSPTMCAGLVLVSQYSVNTKLFGGSPPTSPPKWPGEAKDVPTFCAGTNVSWPTRGKDRQYFDAESAALVVVVCEVRAVACK